MVEVEDEAGLALGTGGRRAGTFGARAGTKLALLRQLIEHLHFRCAEVFAGVLGGIKLHVRLARGASLGRSRANLASGIALDAFVVDEDADLGDAPIDAALVEEVLEGGEHVAGGA